MGARTSHRPAAVRRRPMAGAPVHPCGGDRQGARLRVPRHAGQHGATAGPPLAPTLERRVVSRQCARGRHRAGDHRFRGDHRRSPAGQGHDSRVRVRATRQPAGAVSARAVQRGALHQVREYFVSQRDWTRLHGALDDLRSVYNQCFVFQLPADRQWFETAKGVCEKLEKMYEENDAAWWNSATATDGWLTQLTSPACHLSKFVYDEIGPRTGLRYVWW
ncbi:hypothetical protein DPMN_030809 [Dreissena polymorpha]|uniref:Uncharacterized protein n=1 Tax=Dreissena polymorpha TaxID=45954 RepID=A0A9D4RIF2_DREPO|nr:hypothetical protein DPMN_030809 [Dreissena polymorpha]